MRRNLKRRAGLSLLEVLFAMGIALFGLAGIASLFLMGGRQSSESSQYSEAQGYAQFWYSDFQSRNFNNSGSWAWYRDFGASPGLERFKKDLAVDYDKGPVGSYTFKRELGRESVCLDPYFFAYRGVTNPVTQATGWYRPSVFPYYQDYYNPMVDPAITSTMNTSRWQDQPRMLRVTWTTSPYSLTILSPKVIDEMFASVDDLAISKKNLAAEFDPTVIQESRALDDASQPATRVPELFARPTATVPFPLGKYQNKSEYSWLATLSPVEDSDGATEPTDLYTLSLVVIKGRERIFSDSSQSAPRSPGSAARPTDNIQGERVAYVLPLSGNFVGGAGGRVRLVSSDGADSRLNVGDWVMLGKYFRFTGATPPLRPSSFFRWYRIVAIDSDEQIGTPPADPYGQTVPNEVWAQDVVLDGPDWDFSMTFGAVPTPTTATIVKGAVSVFERVVNVP